MSNEGGGYLRGLVTGVLVGAATALLLTPKRGEDIRQELADSAGRLKEKAEDLSGHLSETAHDLKERSAHLLENARERGSDLIAQADESTSDWETSEQHDTASQIAPTQEKEPKAQVHDVVESV